MEVFTISVGTFVLIALFAAVVRALGTNLGYKVIFGVLAFLIVLQTIRNG